MRDAVVLAFLAGRESLRKHAMHAAAALSLVLWPAALLLMGVWLGRWPRPGAALLASDPHLGFNAPVLWYLARVDLADGRVTLSLTNVSARPPVTARTRPTAHAARRAPFGCALSARDAAGRRAARTDVRLPWPTPHNPFRWHRPDP